MSVIAILAGFAGVPRLLAEDVGSVGHLVSATLQTAGVHTQGEILERFSDAITKIAALCYLCAIAGAVTSAAVFGAYRRAGWLLIGPAVFYFVINTKTTIDGTPLQIGERIVPGSVHDQKKFLEQYVSNANWSKNSQVSYLFVVLDNLVSAVVQDIVEVLTNAKNKDDLVHKSRERVMAWVLRSTPTDPGFLKLVSLGIHGECSEVNRLILELPQHRIDPRKGTGDDNLTQQGKDLKQKYQVDKKRNRDSLALDDDVLNFLFQNESAKKEHRGQPKSCEWMWENIQTELNRFANDRLKWQKFVGEGPYDKEVPWERVEADVTKALNRFGTSNAGEVLAAFILKNIMKRSTHAAMTAQLAERMPANAERRSTTWEEFSRSESYSGFLRIIYFAGSIPYIQGVLLFLLAAVFPFFAIFLVMPGRAHSFLVWFSLWAWVKSWDIGFALVDIARRVMWYYSNFGPDRYGTGLDWKKPESVFALIYDNDPLATENTYHQLVALMMVSVPLLTAHCCLGATNLFDAFKMSIDGTTNRLGQLRGAWTKRELATKALQDLKEAKDRAGNDYAVQQLGGVDSRGVQHQPQPLTTAFGHNLTNRNDGTKAELRAILYMKGVAEWQLSPDGRRHAARVAAFTGRRISFLNGASKTLADSYTRAVDLTHSGRDQWTGNVFPGGIPGITGGASPNRTVDPAPANATGTTADSSKE